MTDMGAGIQNQLRIMYEWYFSLHTLETTIPKEEAEGRIWNEQKMRTVVKTVYLATKFCLFHVHFWTAIVCRGNVPSWLDPSLLVGDNIQAQGHFSCDYLPDHHWGSAVGKRKWKRQYQGVTTRLRQPQCNQYGKNKLLSLMGGCQ